MFSSVAWVVVGHLLGAPKRRHQQALKERLGSAIGSREAGDIGLNTRVGLLIAWPIPLLCPQGNSASSTLGQSVVRTQKNAPSGFLVKLQD